MSELIAHCFHDKQALPEVWAAVAIRARGVLTLNL